MYGYLHHYSTKKKKKVSPNIDLCKKMGVVGAMFQFMTLVFSLRSVSAGQRDCFLKK